ncbi:MAG: DsbA family oxidoreductase [Fibrobacteres bacterium]|nr:DsbA family oxidoreductase [Fibrobacterota bacterium]
MEIEIWSDVVCPFCYLGKRRLEKALEEFPGRDEVNVTWKSFQLHPGLKAKPGLGLETYLAERKGWSLSQIRANHDRLAQAGAELGLEYRFEKAVIADTFDAHRLIQLAKAEGKGEALEERLFRAYFTEGRDLGEAKVLAGLAGEAGIDPVKTAAVLADKESFAAEVRADIEEAERLGVTGVPFFVFDRRFAVSGAQDAEVFRRALAQATEP